MPLNFDLILCVVQQIYADANACRSGRGMSYRVFDLQFTHTHTHTNSQRHRAIERCSICPLFMTFLTTNTHANTHAYSRADTHTNLNTCLYMFALCLVHCMQFCRWCCRRRCRCRCLAFMTIVVNL